MGLKNNSAPVVRKTLARVGEDVREAPPGDRVRLRGHVFNLVSAGAGLPRDVDRIAPRLTPDDIAVANRFTAQARRKLEMAGANWVDETAARIRAEDLGLVVLVESGASPSRSEPATAFSSAALHVGERLLIAREVEPVAAIAAAADVSLGRVTQVLQWFDEQGFTKKQGGSRGRTARRTLDTEALLNAWVEASVEEHRPTVLGHATTRDPQALADEIEERLVGYGSDYRFTGWVGLARSAPFLTATPAVHLYLNDHEYPLVAERPSMLGLVPVTEAGLVTIWQAPRVTFTAPPDAHVVHAARLMADLRRLGGRGVDAAEHVKGELFGGC